MSATIHEGDALAILRTLPSDHYHGSLTDPPYGLSFMGHAWDHGVPSAEVWAEVLRCLRPGAHLLAFGGTRTFHRLTCAIEDAGFEIRDCMMWLYGSGFPKSHDVSKAIDKANGDWRGKAGAVTSGNAAMGGPNYERTPKGEPVAAAAVQWSGHGTALKPAWEPIIVARKPLDGTVAENVQRWGCGGLAIDACRVGTEPVTTVRPEASKTGKVLGAFRGGPSSTHLGRWPANVIMDEEAGAMLDAQSGNRKSATNTKPSGGGSIMSGLSGEARTNGYRAFADGNPYRGEEGGASRFFYCPKASRAERDAGLEEFEAAQSLYTRGTGLKANGDGSERSERSESRNIHPTVKPIALARYLARLILPPVPDARMLTPFSGSGSEVIGALQAGWSHVDGIDSWDVAVRISRARIAHWSAQ